MARRRTRIDPTTRLAIALGAVGNAMSSPAARQLAARQADAISATYHERNLTRHARFIGFARSFLRGLPQLHDDELEQAALDARRFADALYIIIRAPRLPSRPAEHDGVAA